MKVCLACNATYPSETSCCVRCGWSPAVEGRFATYAPALAEAGNGFKAVFFSELAHLEAKHFWFRARNNLIIWALGKYCAEFRSFLEIGCGTGFVLSGVADAYPKAKLQGSEIFTAGLVFASEREPAIDFMQMDARNIPFVEEFDVIGAFDVLEHITEDGQVLAQMHNALKPNGVAILTVPQHAWLWSPVDDHACHVRRYSSKDIHSKVGAAGFEILRSTSFVSSLLPAMFVSRMLQKRGSREGKDATAELKISPWLNYVFETALRAEIQLIRGGVSLPIGGSRLIVARKL